MSAPVIEKIDPSELDPLLRTANKSLMVAFINHDLLTRASLDVRHSVVFYDEDKMFRYAGNVDVDDELLTRLAASTDVRYYSIGT